MVATLAVVLLILSALILSRAAAGPSVPMLDAATWLSRDLWECRPPAGVMPEEWAFLVVDASKRGRAWCRMARDCESMRDAFLEFAKEHCWLPAQHLHVRTYSWGGDAWVMVDTYAPGRGLAKELDAALSRRDSRRLKS